MFRSYSDIVTACKRSEKERTMAIAGAQDGPVLDAALRAEDENIANPIFIGDDARIRELLRRRDRNPSDYNIIEGDDRKSAETAVSLVLDGSANLLMKGLIETRDMLHPVVAHLGTGDLMSHVAFFGNVPHFPRLIVVTDAGMVMYPTLEEKAGIINNAVRTLLKMGYSWPRVAVLCAIEFINPKMKESVEAAKLREMNLSGEIPNCTVYGPISYDIAMDAQIAIHKGYYCPYCGDFDILLVPDINCGNLLSKSLMVTAGAKLGGIVVGAKAPIVLTSRGSSAEEKFNSIAIAALTASRS